MRSPTLPLVQSRATRRISPALSTFISLSVAHMMIDCLGSVWPIFKMLAGLDLQRAGMMLSVAMICGAGLQPIFGMWADRGHRRALILTGATLTPLMMLLGPISRHDQFMHHWSGYTAMFLLLIVAKIGMSMFHPPAASMAGDLAPGRRSTFLTLFVACGLAGMASSQRIFSVVYLGASQHTEWLLIPAGLAVLMVVLWSRPNDSDAHRADIGLGLRSLGTQMLRLPPQLRLLWTIQVLVTATGNALIFLLPEFASFRGYPAWWVHGGSLLLWVAGTALMAVPIGRLADHWGRRPMLIGCVILGTLLYYFLVWAPPLSAFWFSVMLVTFGAVYGPVNPLLVSYGQHLSPQQRSLSTGVMMGLAWGAAAPASWLVGYLVKQQQMALPSALGWMGLGAVMAMVLVLALPSDR